MKIVLTRVVRRPYSYMMIRTVSIILKRRRVSDLDRLQVRNGPHHNYLRVHVVLLRVGRNAIISNNIVLITFPQPREKRERRLMFTIWRENIKSKNKNQSIKSQKKVGANFRNMKPFRCQCTFCPAAEGAEGQEWNHLDTWFMPSWTGKESSIWRNATLR